MQTYRSTMQFFVPNLTTSAIETVNHRNIKQGMHPSSKMQEHADGTVFSFLNPTFCNLLRSVTAQYMLVSTTLHATLLLFVR